MKRLRLICLATAALAVVIASVGSTTAVASASHFAAGEYPATVSGEPTFIHFSFSGQAENCTGGVMEAELSGPSASIVPAFTSGGSCEGSEKATLSMNNCVVIFHPGVQTGPGTYGGTFEIGPSTCSGVDLNGSFCKRHIVPQTGLTANFENGESTLTARVETGGVQYSWTGFGCGNGYGSLTAPWSLRAKNGAGAYTSLTVAKTAVFMTGAASGEAEKQPKMAAELYPTQIQADQSASAKHTFVFESPYEGSKVTCSTSRFNAELTASANAVSITPTYSSCTAATTLGSLPASVETNGCSYLLHVANAGPPYSGTIDVSCPSGKAIYVRDYGSKKQQEEGKSLCSYKVSPQSGLTGPTLATVGSGTERGAALVLGLSKKLTYTAEGSEFPCGKNGTYSTGSYTGESVFYAVG